MTDILPTVGARVHAISCGEYGTITKFDPLKGSWSVRWDGRVDDMRYAPSYFRTRKGASVPSIKVLDPAEWVASYNATYTQWAAPEDLEART